MVENRSLVIISVVFCFSIVIVSSILSALYFLSDTFNKDATISELSDNICTNEKGVICGMTGKKKITRTCNEGKGLFSKKCNDLSYKAEETVDCTQKTCSNLISDWDCMLDGTKVESVKLWFDHNPSSGTWACNDWRKDQCKGNCTSKYVKDKYFTYNQKEKSDIGGSSREEIKYIDKTESQTKDAFYTNCQNECNIRDNCKHVTFSNDEIKPRCWLTSSGDLVTGNYTVFVKN